MSKRTARKIRHKLKGKTLFELSESPNDVSNYNEIYYELNCEFKVLIVKFRHICRKVKNKT